MVLGCHDRWPLSSLAFVREWTTQPKLFSVRGFAARKVAVPSSGFVGTAIGDSSTAAIAVVPKRAVGSVELQTSGISRPLKEGLIIETINEPIGNVWLKVS